MKKLLNSLAVAYFIFFPIMMWTVVIYAGIPPTIIAVLFLISVTAGCLCSIPECLVDLAEPIPEGQMTYEEYKEWGNFFDEVRNPCPYCHKEHLDYACDAQIADIEKTILIKTLNQ